MGVEETGNAGFEPALSAVEPVEQDENPMRFFADNVDKWGALEWFNRMVDACEDHDRKRTQAFRCADADEKDMLSLSADTSKMIMSSSAFRLAREHADDIRSALSAQVQDVAVERTEICDRCQGNGEIVTDWERYRHPHENDVGDEAVSECPDCDGIGKVSAKDVETPEGWRLVPKVPTDEMLCAVDHDDCATPDAAERAYRAMLAAAPAKQEG